jgi:hypothetical protein
MNLVLVSFILVILGLSRKLIISLKQKTKIFGKNDTTLVGIWHLSLCPSHHLWQSSYANPSWFLTPPKASCTKRKPKHGAYLIAFSLTPKIPWVAMPAHVKIPTILMFQIRKIS